MELNELTKLIINKAILVHKELGPGLYEEVYQECLYHELTLSKLQVLKELHVPVCYKGIIFNHAYKADLVVSDSVVVELKALEQLTSSHQAQLLTYLRFLSKPLGLLINFNNKRLVDGIVRLINPRVFPSASSGDPLGGSG
jgi:GxxExxY protein